MTEQQEQMWDVLVALDGETLLQAITDYHGLQILDDGFAEFLVDDGLMEQPDEEEEEPEDGDYIISDCGALGSCTQVCVFCGHWADKAHAKLFDTEEAAEKAIKADMEAQNYWPDVWRQDDHGGMSRYEMDMA
jgi:hypothetical protein